MLKAATKAAIDGQLKKITTLGTACHFPQCMDGMPSQGLLVISPRATSRTVGGVTRITKKNRDHEILITKINIRVIFNVFTKFLDHENLELYGSATNYYS